MSNNSSNDVFQVIKSILENETHKHLWDFKIQTVPLISARRPNLVIVKRKKGEPPGFWTWTLLVNKKKKTMEHEGDGNTSCNQRARYSHQRIGLLPTGGIGNKNTSSDHPNYSTVKIGQNTEKSPGDLKRLVVTQAPVEDHRLTLV